MADFSSLKTAIQNAIRTNGNNEITGQLLQDILLSMVVVLGDEAITNVADDLSTETSQRQNADGTLQGNINGEATARAVADTALQNAINTINSNISNGYVYAGIATPSATPVTGKVFYIATTAGTYTNFGGLTVTKGINILKYNGSTWSQEQIIGIDDYPTAGSSKLALSGGIDAEIKSLVGYYTCGTAAATAAKTITASAYILLQGGSIKVKFTYKNTAADATLKIGSADAKPLFYGGRRAGSSNSWEAGEVVEIFYDGTNYMANNVMGGGAGDGAFDISVYNAVDGTPTPYADLAAALGTNGANIPDTLRKGGMSVKFIQGTVQSSDNKYVQYRLMLSGSFTVAQFTNIANWQGVGANDRDVRPIFDNLIKYDEAIRAYLRLSDGAIISQPNGTYRVFKTYLSAGIYYFRTWYKGSTQLLMVKFTDDTYTTVDSIIIRTPATEIYDTVRELDAGYYAVSFSVTDIEYPDSFNGAQLFNISKLARIFNGSLDLYNVVTNTKRGLVPAKDTWDNIPTENSENFINSGNIYNAINNVILKPHRPVFDNLIKFDEVISAYIRNTDGIIVEYTGAGQYKVFKTYLPAGTYYIKLMYSGTQALLCKYTDDTYETRSETIIGAINTNYEGFKTLEAGYYALSFTTVDSLASYNDSYLFNIDRFLYMYNNSVPVINNTNGRNIATIGNKSINGRYEGVVFQSEFVGADYLKGHFINDSGNIVEAASDYIVWKFQLSAANYYVRLINVYNHVNFVKYTDDTYTTEERIFSRSDYEGIMTLDAGYYALVTNNGNAKDSVLMNADTFKELLIPETKTLPLVLDSPMLNGKYISDTGVISDATTSYKLVKAHVPYDGFWTIGVNISNNHLLLAKYTDGTYTTLEKIIIGAASNYTSRRFLSAGYYAVCSNSNPPSISYVRKDVVNDLCDFLEKRGNVGGIQNFAEFSLIGWNKVSDNVIQSTGVGYENKAAYPYTTYEDEFILKANVTPKTADANGYFSICLGKAPTSSNDGGTGMIVGKDANGNFVSIGKIKNGVYTEASRFTLPGLRIAVNHTLSITLQKVTDTRMWFKATVTDDRGGTYTTDKVYDMNSTFSEIVGGYAHGRIVLYSVVGVWESTDFSFGYHKNLSDIKLVIMGHSFVEGLNSTIANRNLRFSSMLANDVGIDNCCIFGLGGGNVNMFSFLEKQLSWLSTTKYALLCFGTNDTDTLEIAEKFNNFDRLLKAWQITPIWMTIAPRANGTEMNVLNQYIKEHFKYVDITQIFYDDNGNIDTTYLSGDGVHPSIEGYERIYNVVKSQCAGFFEI